MQAVKIKNYPYEAIEEAVVNAFYHRDYMLNEPTRAVEFNAGSNGTGAKKGRCLTNAQAVEKYGLAPIEYWKARGRDAMKGVQ